MYRIATRMAVGAALLAAATSAAAANAVVAWNGFAGEAAIAACLAPGGNPLHESRAYAMMHIAVHDAVNAIDRRFQPYAYRTRAARSASPTAAVATAAHDVLVATLPPDAACSAGSVTVEAHYVAALAAIPDGPAKTAGIEVGHASAAAVLALRATDGSDTPLVVDATGYVQGTTPGAWRFTPDVPFAFAPGWGTVTPFVLADAAQYRPGPPPSLTSRRYTRDYREVKRLGGDDITTASARTPNQTEIALFWLESSPLGWNRIARQVSTRRHQNVWQSARMFGLLNVSMADGYIASFATKYHYAFWRPVTAIREAATDGNGATAPDPTWTPLRTTPPIPDYESAHAVEGAAAVAAMQGVLHTDRVRFSTCSYTLPAGSTCTDPTPVRRRFTKLSQAARENGESRILIGFHFRTAVQKGLVLGDAIGDRAVARLMRPVG